MAEKIIELVFIPFPVLSHFAPLVKLAKLLTDADRRLSVTILILKTTIDTKIDSFTRNSSHSRVRFVRIVPQDESMVTDLMESTQNFMIPFIESQKKDVRNAVAEMMEDPTRRTSGFVLDSSDSNHTSRSCFKNLHNQQSNSSDFIDGQTILTGEIVSGLMNVETSGGGAPRLAGLVVDMFCTKFIDVANEFGLPSYVFFASGACYLGVISELISLQFEKDQEPWQFINSDTELYIPCFSIPVPSKVLPFLLVTDNPMANISFTYFNRFKEAKGIIINTFYELEPYAIESLSDGKIPKVYPVGPILNLSSQTDSHCSGQSAENDDEIMKWLDNQPDSSVVFLCFGSLGSFEKTQLKEIALALERSEQRFLWSMRNPDPKGEAKFPTEHEDFQESLPEWFLERTEGVGKVIGWAPQAAVLSHSAVGGFVSHCGWNSTLESLWCGVPVATFPLYAEQQLNAFELVKELGLAVEIRLDYHKKFYAVEGDEQEIVMAEVIEAAIRRLMAEDGGGGVRQKVKEMQKTSWMALKEGGSSSMAIDLFINDVIENIS